MAPQSNRSAALPPSTELRSKNTEQVLNKQRKMQIAGMVAATAHAMETPMSAETLDLWVYDLAHLPNEVIAHALARVRREIKGRDGFKPVWALCDVLDRAGVVNTAAVEDAEARVAWDAVLDRKS